MATSKRRNSVFISTASRDRARANARAAAASAAAASRGRRSGRGDSEAHALAASLRTQREERLASRRKVVRLRIAAIAAGVLIVLGSCWALYSSPLFTITSVEVAGVNHITAAQVRALARVPADATLIRFPADEVEARVGADPWVASVAVSRVFPSGMRIRVTERTPVAVVDAGSSVWLIDGAGMVIAKPSSGDTGTLPVIRDVPGLDLKAGRRTVSEPLLNALAVLVGIDQTLRAQVGTVSAPTVDGATLVTQDRVEIVMGEATELRVKSELALRILTEQKGKVVSIDVRVTDRPTWRGLK